MDKQEILEKSRKENKNQDLFEKEVLETAAKISMVVIAVICLIFTVFEISIGAKSYFIFPAIVLAGAATQSIYKAVKFKLKKDVVASVLDAVSALMFFAAYLIVMIKTYF